MRTTIVKISQEANGVLNAPFTPLEQAKSVAEFVALGVPITGLYRVHFPTPYFTYKDGEETAESDVLIIQQEHFYTIFSTVGDYFYPFALWDMISEEYSFGEHAPEWCKFPTNEEIIGLFQQLRAMI